MSAKATPPGAPAEARPINQSTLSPRRLAALCAEAVGEEADMLSADYARRFPGLEATDHGISYDLARLREHGTMEGWPP